MQEHALQVQYDAREARLREQHTNYVQHLDHKIRVLGGQLDVSDWWRRQNVLLQEQLADPRRDPGGPRPRSSAWSSPTQGG